MRNMFYNVTLEVFGYTCTLLIERAALSIISYSLYLGARQMRAASPTALPKSQVSSAVHLTPMMLMQSRNPIRSR